MPTSFNPYLNFAGNAREAMEFYKSIFGGELTSMTFGDMDPTSAQPTGIMHADLQTPNGIRIMASDTHEEMELSKGSSISLSLSGEDKGELTGYFDKLSADGQVQQPLTAAPWGDTFGMCADRFGVVWLFNITGAAS